MRTSSRRGAETNRVGARRGRVASSVVVGVTFGALAICASVNIAHAQTDASLAEPGVATTTTSAALDSLAAYFSKLETAKLIDVQTGTIDTLRKELVSSEALLGEGAFHEAAIALYGIVASPRFAALNDFVEFQNAEYDLGVALFRSGAFGASVDAFTRILRRGSSATYWGPAHRRVVDIALEMRDHDRHLAMLTKADKKDDVVPPSAVGERAYLRARGLYDRQDFDAADAELTTISRKSRLYSSALYLRGVIAARKGKYRRAADAMCEIAGAPGTDRFAFVVDDRYFTIKDLARLGLGRIAHEQGKYDDAYYHYFQIPDDSTYLSEALFEAAWAMYQKRELATARDLTAEFLASFPNSPLWPEATLLAGYIELADCKFDDSQKLYDALVEKLEPVVAELDAVRQDPSRTGTLFSKAIGGWRQARQTGDTQSLQAAKTKPTDVGTQVLGLLRVDPVFLRLSDAVKGSERAAGEAPGTTQSWLALRNKIATTNVAGATEGPASSTTSENDQVNNDLYALADEARRSLAHLELGARSGAVPADVATAERARLQNILERINVAEAKASQASGNSSDAATGSELPNMVARDLEHARQLEVASRNLRRDMNGAVQTRALQSVERLYNDTRRVLDKAKLGKIDAVIGQKRKLDIAVQDLAAGRFPAELIGRMWNAGLIGDDEELWPLEGDFWADEYEGWR
ncbi:MAG: hypothetical protein KBG15_19990 [Kofleriaceae bacterium]|nr:hypothetical protein [Kofleriaceae bacterium]